MVNTPKNKASAGRILIKPRGEWDANITYEMLDLVNHNGYAYLAKRTVVGIEPTDEYSTYWHSLLDIKTIVENSIAETVADEVGDILSERFRDEMSEALYVSNLVADFTEPTFVKWDAETENTPYTEGLTECTEGFALAFGAVASNHTVVAWAKGGNNLGNFTHYISNGKDKGWDVLRLDLANNVSGILGIEYGGHGGSTKEEALVNLGVPEYVEENAWKYQRPWNVDANVGRISYTDCSLSVDYYYANEEQVKTCAIPMINSGKLYLDFTYSFNPNLYTEISHSVKVYINDEVIATYNKAMGYRTLLDVVKGDVVTIVQSAIAPTTGNFGKINVSGIRLTANIETAYTYNRLDENLEKPSTEEILNVLLGGAE